MKLQPRRVTKVLDDGTTIDQTYEPAYEKSKHTAAGQVVAEWDAPPDGYIVAVIVQVQYVKIEEIP